MFETIWQKYLNLQRLVREAVLLPMLQYSLNFSIRVLTLSFILHLTNHLPASPPGSAVGFHQGRASLSFLLCSVSPGSILVPEGS